jgi:hypothetical protein
MKTVGFHHFAIQLRFRPSKRGTNEIAQLRVGPLLAIEENHLKCSDDRTIIIRPFTFAPELL